MSAVCQDSLARQQNIDRFQLAEFPSLGCGCGQSEAGLMEQSALTVATAPLSHLHSSHSPPCFCQMAKMTCIRAGKAAIPAAQGNVNPHLVKEED